MALILSKADPLFRAELREAPAMPLGGRCIVLPRPVTKETEGKLVKPDVAQERTFAGFLLEAGDQAADKLYDIDCRIGDEVWYGKYCGVIEAWERIVKDGSKKCKHDGAWDHVPKGNFLGSARDPRWDVVKDFDEEMVLVACRACEALKLTQRVIFIDGEDVMCSVDAQVRRERGITRRVRGTTTDGRTRYYIEREPGFVDTFETKGAR